MLVSTEVSKTGNGCLNDHGTRSNHLLGSDQKVKMDSIQSLFPFEIQATQPEDIKNEAEVTINYSAASGSSGNLQNFYL